jgi:hypothetical protein
MIEKPLKETRTNEKMDILPNNACNLQNPVQFAPNQPNTRAMPPMPPSKVNPKTPVPVQFMCLFEVVFSAETLHPTMLRIDR